MKEQNEQIIEALKEAVSNMEVENRSLNKQDLIQIKDALDKDIIQSQNKEKEIEKKHEPNKRK